MTGWDLRSVILATGGFTILYTAIGGIQGVVWTDVVQGVILIAGAVLLLVRLVFAPEAGPPGAVFDEAYRGGRFNLGSFELSWQSLFDSQNTTQWLFMLAFIINWGRRYIADQHMVQRYLIARTDREAQIGTIANALACVPIYVAFMVVGACLYGYYNLVQKPGPELVDNVVPYFIAHEMPRGIIGIMLAAILAASMSSISGDLNSVATVITTDYFANFMPGLSDRAKVLIGRAAVLVSGALAAWVAILMVPAKGTASIMERVIVIASILSGGTLGLFLLGFLTRRATRLGAYTGIGLCIVFTAWAILTSRSTRVIDAPINFTMNPILIGVFGQLIVFVTGYLASVILGGYRPADIERLTFRGAKRRGAVVDAEHGDPRPRSSQASFDKASII
jgi:SSS family solute:Na+ symporter